MYSKAEQLKSNRIKPIKVSTFGKRKQIKKKRVTNDSELAYNNWLHEKEQMEKFKCMVCGKQVEHYHHVKWDSTDKKRQFVQMPLCNEHHVGNELSPHGKPVLWRQTYSLKQQEKEALKLLVAFKERKKDGK